MPRAAVSGGRGWHLLRPGAGIRCGLGQASLWLSWHLLRPGLAVRVILGELAKGNKEIKKVDARH